MAAAAAVSLQAKDKVVAAVEKAVKGLKDDAKKNGELYVKSMKKALEKVRSREGRDRAVGPEGRSNSDSTSTSSGRDGNV